jgi:hypothetical protein
MITTSFLDLIDRLIQLCRYRTERERRAFDALLQPLFLDLQTVSADYERFLTTVHEKLPFQWEHAEADYIKRLREAGALLTAARIELAPVRARVRSLASELSSLDLPPALSAFARSVLAFFPTGEYSDSSPASNVSPSLRLLEELDAQLLGNPGCDVKTTSLALLKTQRRLWSDVCDAFSRVQLKNVGLP